MDGTGARTGHADTSRGAGEGPARPARPADATGPLPLPVRPPADPTGPLPAAGSWFTRADETAAQPAVGAPPATPTPPTPPAPPSWFATGPLPPVPASADTTAWPAVPDPLHTPPATHERAVRTDLLDESAARPTEDPPDPARAPQARRSGRHAAPTGGVPVVPAAPVRPADATGPMPALVAPAGAGAPAGTAAEETGAWSPPAPAAEKPPRTDSWSFGAGPAAPADEAWSFGGDDRRSGSTQTWPPPAPAGRAHRTAPSTGHGTGATDTAPTRRSPWPLLIAGVLVAVAAGVALVFALARADPADLVASAADEAARWPGVQYRGAVAALDGGEIAFDLTVTPDGAAGTLTRDGGRASAELLHDASGTLLRANREWWLYHQPARADDLAGTWVAEPLTETQEIAPVLQLAPAALAEHVRAEPAAPWEALEQQLVDGRVGVVLTDGTRRLVVGDDDPHAPLAVDVVPGTEARVVAVPAEEAAAAAGGAAAVRREFAPRTLTRFLLERPVVEIQLQPEPLCTAPTCRVAVTVTNSGTVPARGRLEVSADGQVVATHPLDVPPGQGATFEASAPNPQFSQPGSSGQILWESRAIDE